MLKNTFCHLPDISITKERKLWSAGIHTWQALLDAEGDKRVRINDIRHITNSIKHLEEDNPCYFADLLLPAHHWRLFPDFRQSIAYLDIETTGLGRNNHITTIALYDGNSVFTFVHGKNLSDFKKRIKQYKVLVTFNGKSFDVPFIERQFGMKLPLPNIDLMYVLRSLGYTGGLKACERNLGIDRKGLTGIDGYDAVLLWHEYAQHKDIKTLDSLLAYNVEDVLNLEILLTKAYNEKITATPFHKTHKLRLPKPADNPFEPDQITISKILRKRGRRHG